MRVKAFTRRQVAVNASAAIAALSVPAVVRAAGTPAKRKNIDALSTPELDAYKHAIQIVKNRSAANPDDPAGYQFWAALHDNSDDSIHSGCAHFSEKFFPWHRRFLSDFEHVLQQTDPPVTSEVMIPYWDWTQPPKGGGHFPQAFLDSSSPLFDVRLNLTPPPWDSADILNMVKEPDWNVFAGKPDPSNQFGNNPGAVESGPHNTLHTRISRHMKVPATAVQDPIFWSFHAGIDLVWSRWQRLHVPQGTAQKFSDGAAMLFFRDRSFTVSSTANIADFGYEYDYDFSGDGPAAAPAVGPALAGLIAERRGTASPQRTVTLKSVATDHDLVAQTPAPGSLGNNALLRLGGVKVFHDKSYSLVLYLHPNNITLSSLSPQDRDQYRMRVLTLWQGHHDIEVELFVRPTAAQLARLNEGWTLTVQSEEVPEEGTQPMARDMAAHGAAAPATSGLVKSLEIQER